MRWTENLLSLALVVFLFSFLSISLGFFYLFGMLDVLYMAT